MSRPVTRLPEHFGQIDDPRVARTKQHLLIDILVIAICAVICYAAVPETSHVDIESGAMATARETAPAPATD